MSYRDMYRPLKDHLSARRDREVTFTYKEIEKILGCALPPSAHGESIRQWWANTMTHSQSRAWLEAGWRARISVDDKRVVFTRDRENQQTPSIESDSEIGVRGLTPVGRRFVEDYCEEFGVTAEEAIAAIIDKAALDRRKRLIDWFAVNSPKSTSDSVDLIREDRDAR